MEMTTEEIPQTQEQPQEEEVKGWLTLEEKEKLIEELDAFEDAGGKLDDFVTSKGVSKWSLIRYRKQVNKHKPRIKFMTKHGAKEAKFKEANNLASGGMSVTEACQKSGITVATYYYYLKKKPQREMKSRKYTPRRVKTMPAVTDDTYNKSLRARVVTLEKLVVELSLDKQALMEAREGAI